MKILVRLLLCFIISFTLIEVPSMKAAHAGMLSTSKVLSEMSRAQGEKTLSSFLERSDVKSQLIGLGIEPEEAHQRVALLSDKEVRQLAGDIEKAQVGGDVVGILLIVLLVLGIIYFAKRV